VSSPAYWRDPLYCDVMVKADEAGRLAEAGTEEQAQQPAGAESPAALFGEILKSGGARPTWPVGEPFVVECTSTQHPTLRGRVQIRWTTAAGAATAWWVPVLQGLAIRAGDRLLAQVPHGATEPIVLGVIDGFAARPEPERAVAARLELKKDEAVQICSQEGQPLVELVQDAQGPLVRLLQADTRIDVKGKLTISAAELELCAVKGKVRIEATDDVEVVGEVINLN